jgi:hypothetical protein
VEFLDGHPLFQDYILQAHEAIPVHRGQDTCSQVGNHCGLQARGTRVRMKQRRGWNGLERGSGGTRTLSGLDVVTGLVWGVGG